MNLGDLIDYKFWINERFSDEIKETKLQRNREAIWESIGKLVSGSRKKILVLEFGVAWGYLTWWWIKKFSEIIEIWHGFDSFNGLPKEWRGFKKGTFDADGETPNIEDSRIVWHVGEVRETLQNFEFLKSRTDQQVLVVFFDLDLFEPTLLAWKKILPSLKKGDILYFDEAFDADERRIIEEHILPVGAFRLISASWTSLALEVCDITLPTKKISS